MDPVFPRGITWDTQVRGDDEKRFENLAVANFFVKAIIDFMDQAPLKTPVQFVKGVGPYLATLLAKKGLVTVRDLLYFLPVNYLDRRLILPIRQLTPGPDRCIKADVVGGASRSLGGSRRRIFELLVKDETGIALLIWFHFNEKYLQKKYPAGKKLMVFGTCQLFGAQKQFVHPEIEEEDEDEKGKGLPILPVYSLTEGFYQKVMRRIVFNALDYFLKHLEETPLSVRPEGSTLGLAEALEKIHRPPSEVTLDDLIHSRSKWHQRVIYDELFYLQLGLSLRKNKIKKKKGLVLKKSESLLPKAFAEIPFELTKAQKKVLAEIESDLSRGEPMNRLLQGDVGCGKTLVAFLASLMAAENGYQTAFMAPTEILAGQHFLTLQPIAAKLDIRLGLLTGSTSKAERENLLADLVSGKIHILLGTHALIQEGVNFQKLGLIIVDEQHRFGVLQRAALQQKSILEPHILVMTATPIPRTLSMSIYGDLDVSVIDELPAGRKPILTQVYRDKARARSYELIRAELNKGRQAYFVYPLIEESEKLDLKNAQTMAVTLAETFSEFKVGLLHGKMKAAEKEKVMDEFKKNKIQILVSTTVIEVGVNVPNSTVMVIEHAERFGLSQLHQLRGRVGRGGDQSYCVLMAGYAQSEEGRFRLHVMEETNDGFQIAEEDLKLRGPGDFLGTRQSGLPDFHLASLIRDGHLLTVARQRAFEIVAMDPDLKKPEHQLLKKILAERWGEKLNLADIS